MTNTFGLCVIAGTMAAIHGLLPLTSATTSQAVAQQLRIVVPGVNYSWYNGYSSYYNRGYQAGYIRQGYTVYGIGPYGYGSTMYGFGSTAPFGYRSTVEYGYPYGTSQQLFYRGSRSPGGNETYRPIYIPPKIRYYSPYGYGGY